MTCIDRPITINKGNSYIIELVVKDEEGAVQDLTGVQDVRYTMSRSVTAPTPYFSKGLSAGGIVIKNPDLGILEVTVTSSDTNLAEIGRGYHELLLVDHAGNYSTLINDVIEIKETLLF